MAKSITVVSAKKRIMPLTKFVIKTGFNESMTLILDESSSNSCELQKVEKTKKSLLRVREAIKILPVGKD